MHARPAEYLGGPGCVLDAGGRPLVAGCWRKVHARPAECLGACGALDTGGRALVAGGRGYWVLAARCMPELMGVGRPSGTRGHG